MPNRPAFTPVTFRWPEGRLFRSLKGQGHNFANCCCMAVFQPDDKRLCRRTSGGYQKSTDARVLKTTCLFRLSPDTWQGLSSRLPLNATSEAIACPADSAANNKRAPVLLSSHPLTHILCSDAAWPDCSRHQNTHPPVSPFSSVRPASPPAAGQAGTVKVSPSCITRWSQPDSLRSGSKALPVPGPVTSEPETVIATPRFPG